jgi:hypothetical protein
MGSHLEQVTPKAMPDQHELLVAVLLQAVLNCLHKSCCDCPAPLLAAPQLSKRQVEWKDGDAHCRKLSG